MPEKGGLGQFADLRGHLAKKRGVVFLRGCGGADTPMHTMSYNFMLSVTLSKLIVLTADSTYFKPLH